MGTKIRIARFYRQAPGDTDCPSVPLFEETEVELEAVLGEALLARFKDPRPGEKPPHTADVVEEDGTVLLKLYVTDPGHVRRAITANAPAS